MATLKNNLLTPLNYFSKQLAEIPTAKAVICGDSELTFEELDLLSNQLARFILDKGVRKGKPIGVLVNKDVRTLIIILAAWKIGSPYVPIDIEMPDKRIQYILDTCEISFAVVDGIKFKTRSTELLRDQFCLVLDDKIDASVEKTANWKEILKFSNEPLNHSDKFDELAYVIFTSGSTGEPKGVKITVKNLSFFIRWCQETLAITKQSRVLNIANFSFDQSVMDIALLLGCGAQLHLFNSVKHPIVIADTIKKNRIKVLSTVPTIWGMLFDSRNNLPPEMFISLKKVFIGGAACPPAYVHLFYQKMPQAEVYNMYGPTEVTVYCMFHKFTEKELKFGIDRVSLGSPFDQHVTYLVDEERQPTREEGELVVHGPQVMKGYWKQNNSEDMAFLQNPEIINRGYLTGDIVNQNQNGDYFFVGRINETIKSGGYRIDLREIETTLMKNYSVDNVVVISIPDELLENKIIAIVIKNSLFHQTDQEILQFCQKSLPKYMIPAKINFVDSFPLNASGKIDKKALQLQYESGCLENSEKRLTVDEPVI